MTKRRFIGLGRKSRSKNTDKQAFKLPDNFIFGTTNQHRVKPTTQGIKKAKPQD